MEFLSSMTFFNIELIFLVMLRMIGFLVSAPFFSSKYINVYVKVALAYILANVVVSSGAADKITISNDFYSYMLIGIKEVVIGLIIGFSAMIIYNAIILAGSLIDQQIGFSMAATFDPLSGIQMPISANFYNFMFLATLVVMNFHHKIIQAIIYSYNVLDVGVLNFDSRFINVSINFISEMFVIAFKLASPIVGMLLIVNVALGILVRTVPQMNIFVIGIPLKIAIGFYIMLLVTPAIIISFSYIFDRMLNSIKMVIESVV